MTMMISRPGPTWNVRCMTGLSCSANGKTKEQLIEERKLMFDQMEQKLQVGRTPEDSLFYYHLSEDRIILSHAIFWVMTQSFKGKIAKEKYYVLLRQYEEEMLDAYLTEDAYFLELLRYCNILFEYMSIVLHGVYDFATDKAARRLAAIAMVAAGYAGDMPEDLCYELLDNMDFHFNKVKCRKIEQMLPRLNAMVAEEVNTMPYR